jgi:hypothetical protein
LGPGPSAARRLLQPTRSASTHCRSPDACRHLSS